MRLLSFVETIANFLESGPIAEAHKIYASVRCMFSLRTADGGRPALAGMVERSRPLVAQQPRDLRQCKPRFFDILESEAASQLINDHAARLPVFASPPRQDS